LVGLVQYDWNGWYGWLGTSVYVERFLAITNLGGHPSDNYWQRPLLTQPLL